MARAGQPQLRHIAATGGPKSEAEFAAQLDRARITQTISTPSTASGGGAAGIAVIAIGALAVLFLVRK